MTDLKKSALGAAMILGSVCVPRLGWSAAPQGTWSADLDHGSGSVEFRATGHPSALHIVGKGAAPKGRFDVKGTHVSGEASFDLTTLDTGISMRTHHMQEKYLETGKYHDAKLTVTDMTLPAAASSDQFSADQVPFKGTLSLHGVEKPVSGFAKVERSGNKLSVSAQFGLKMSDFDITVPSFAGITVADQVEVSVSDSAPVVAAAGASSRSAHR